MSDAGNQNDQSMDEILASIRKIISDDPVPGEAAPAPTQSQSASHPNDGQSAMPMGESNDRRDDLADILEPMLDRPAEKSVKASAVETNVSPAGAPLKARPAGVGSTWPFDSQPKDVREEPGLQSKLASLDELRAPSAQVALKASPGEANVPATTSPAPERTAVVEKPADQTLVSASSTAGDGGRAKHDQVPGNRDHGTSLNDVRPMPSLAPAQLRNGSVAPSDPGSISSDTVPVDAGSRPADIPAPPVGEERGDRAAAPLNGTAMPALSGGSDTEAVGVIEPTTKEPIAPVAPAPVAPSPVEIAAAEASKGFEAAIAPVVAATAVQKATVVGDASHQKTLEDVVVEALRPMLKDWIDANLPRITEQVVRAEIKRTQEQSGSALKI